MATSAVAIAVALHRSRMLVTMLFSELSPKHTTSPSPRATGLTTRQGTARLGAVLG